MIHEWLLMAVLKTSHGVAAPIQQTYSSQKECEAARKVWYTLTPEKGYWSHSACVLKVKTS